VIYVVDDAEASRVSLASSLSAQYKVESFETAEDCLAKLETSMPDLFLLDVDLPGMNGFERCQRILQRPDGSNALLIFISALDDLDARIAGYEAGGTDFVVKPYKIAEIKQKVEVARRILEQESLLHLRVEEASSMATSILASIGEYAGLIHFLRALNTCQDWDAVARIFLELLGTYGLDGVIQLRDDARTQTFSPKGKDRPLEVAVLH
jgi:DNA-binding response OmpR family regulator